MVGLQTPGDMAVMPCHIEFQRLQGVRMCPRLQILDAGAACPATESSKGCREVGLFPKLKTPEAKVVMACVLRQDPRSLLQTQVSGVSSTWGTNQHVWGL